MGRILGGAKLFISLREVIDIFILLHLLAVVVPRCQPASHPLFSTDPPMVFALVAARSWLSPGVKHVVLV